MTKHSLLWLFSIIAVFLFSPLIMGQKDYKDCIGKELRAAYAWYNEEEVTVIIERANDFYDATMVSTGIDPLLRKHFIKPSPLDEISPGVTLSKSISPYAQHMMEYWLNFLTNIWMFWFRVAHSVAWMLYLIPFLLAVLFDGYMTRKAKLASFKYTSPTVYNLSWHTIIAMASAALVYFSLTVQIPILFYPGILTGMGVLVRLVISNVQHSA